MLDIHSSAIPSSGVRSEGLPKPACGAHLGTHAVEEAPSQTNASCLRRQHRRSDVSIWP